MNKSILAGAIALSLALGVFSLAACSPQPEDSAQPEISYTQESLIGQHKARGTEIANLAEVSIESCTGTGCHGGSYDAVIEETEAIWEGLGQIPDANPHNAHATNGFVCQNCHTLADGPSINQCNGCHAFESPDGWEDKDPTTTVFGLVNDEPLY